MPGKPGGLDVKLSEPSESYDPSDWFQECPVSLFLYWKKMKQLKFDAWFNLIYIAMNYSMVFYPHKSVIVLLRRYSEMFYGVMCLCDAQSRSSLYAEYACCIGPPKHQGAPLLSKMFLILASSSENMNDHLF